MAELSGTKFPEITAAFVLARGTALRELWTDRDTRMDDMEKLYRLEVWEDETKPDERRVTSPRSWMVVEAMRALLFTRRPVIEVPASAVRSVEQTAAERMEKFLYGAWSQMGVLYAIDEVEWNACTLGLGVLRVVYNPETPVGEFPLIAQALDPRTYYAQADPTLPLRDLEAAIWTQRRRRDIEAEWGVSLEGRPEPGTNLESWLDDEVDYVDYWATRIVEEEEVAAEPEPTELAEQEGLLRRAVKRIRGRAPRKPKAEQAERTGDEGRTKTKRRRVVNAVVAEGRFVKEPVVVPGYERLPFFRWSGVRTPMSGKDRDLSVLYAIAGGERSGDSEGLIAAENELLGMRLRLVEQRANAALISNDEGLTNLDTSPGAVNVADRPDFRLDYVVPPGDAPDTGAFMAHIEGLAEDATIPNSMMGRYQANASGVAISAITNPVLMKIAARQREREEVLQEMNAHILALAQEYAPAAGWAVYGLDAQGQELEERLEPGLIKGYRRNFVHLSARLPRDASGEALMLRSLIDSKLLSRRTGVERLQNVLDLSGKSPDDEMKQVLIESILFGDDATRRAMAQRALEEFDLELAAAAGAAAGQIPGPAGVPGPTGAVPPPGPLAQGPMMGLPPQVLPPQAIPEAVGVPNVEAMQRMYQGGPPGAGPVMPGAPV
jgi:hypothetical protein